nr:MAG TPA: hypothetical protein [Caudoviricetes sp.]
MKTLERNHNDRRYLLRRSLHHHPQPAGCW